MLAGELGESRRVLVTNVKRLLRLCGNTSLFYPSLLDFAPFSLHVGNKEEKNSRSSLWKSDLRTLDGSKVPREKTGWRD